MAVRSAAQLRRRHRVERLIRLAAPALDLLLAAGEQLSRVAGRDDLEPEPARRSSHSPLAPPPKR